MQSTTSHLAPELQAFTPLLDTQPPEVQEAGKFEPLNVAEVDGPWYYTFRSAGEVFCVVRPEMSREMERTMREEVREMLGAEIDRLAAELWGLSEQELEEILRSLEELRQ